jgi:hypothetical protein
VAQPRSRRDRCNPQIGREDGSASLHEAIRISHLRDATFRVVCSDTRSPTWQDPRSPECRFMGAERSTGPFGPGRTRLTARPGLPRSDYPGLSSGPAHPGSPSGAEDGYVPISWQTYAHIHPNAASKPPGHDDARPSVGTTGRRGPARVAASADEAQAAKHAADRPAAGAVRRTTRGSAHTAVGAGSVVFVRLTRVATGARLDHGGLHRRGRRSDRWGLRLTRGR